jgi:hypothetical protein
LHFFLFFTGESCKGEKMDDGGSFDDTLEIRALQRKQDRGSRQCHKQSWKELFDSVLQK